MLTIKETRVMWAWVCPVTGMVLDDTWGITEAYTRTKTERMWGKHRTDSGDFLAVCVTIELLGAESTAEHRAEFAAWRERKDRETAERRIANEGLGGG